MIQSPPEDNTKRIATLGGGRLQFIDKTAEIASNKSKRSIFVTIEYQTLGDVNQKRNRDCQSVSPEQNK